MFDLTPDARMQRSQGRAFVGFAARNGSAKLATLHQSGSAKAMLPRVAGSVPEVVFLNTSGGLTGGDTLVYHLDIPAKTEVTATTQTAERGYATTGGQARVSVTARVGAGGRLNWLPQETLIYEAANVSRETTVDLDAGATCLMVETIVLGRHAMGERPTTARLTDHRMIRREGRPVWTETLKLDETALSLTSQPAILGGARAFAVIALVAPGAQDATGSIRSLLTEPGCQSAASGWDGKLLVRILAHDGWPLRRQTARVLRALNRTLPRVWQMQGVDL